MVPGFAIDFLHEFSGRYSAEKSVSYHRGVR